MAAYLKMAAKTAVAAGASRGASARRRGVAKTMARRWRRARR